MRARVIAAILSRAWRSDPPEVEVSALEIEAVVPRLLATGSAALAFHALSNGRHRRHPSLAPLRDAHRFSRLRATLFEERLERVALDLAEDGIEVIVLKGWSLARGYAVHGLRPSGDIDLVVRPSAAARTLAIVGARSFVDVHSEVHFLETPAAEPLFERSRLATIGDARVRVLSPEDELRAVCLHWFAHGAWRPVWLCDVAMLVDTMGDDFDWRGCLSGSAVENDRITCAISLAIAWLGARPRTGCPQVAIAPWVADAIGEAWLEAPVEPLLSIEQILPRPRLWRDAIVARFPRALEVALRDRTLLVESTRPSTWARARVFSSRGVAWIERRVRRRG